MKHKIKFFFFSILGILCIAFAVLVFLNRSAFKALYEDIRWEKSLNDMRKAAELFRLDIIPPDTVTVAGHFFVPSRVSLHSDTVVMYYLYVPNKDSVSFDVVKANLTQSGYSPKPRFQKRYNEAESLRLINKKKKTYIESFMWGDELLFEITAPPDTIREWVKHL